MSQPVELCILNVTSDDAYRQAFLEHLRPLERTGLLHVHRAEVHEADPFERWQLADQVAIVVILLSAAFLDSDQFDLELFSALREKDRIIVPILIRDCAWQSHPISRWRPLMYHAKSIANSPSQDAAWTEIVSQLTRIVTDAQRESEQAEATVEVQEPGGERVSGRDMLRLGAGAVGAIGIVSLLLLGLQSSSGNILQIAVPAILALVSLFSVWRISNSYYRSASSIRIRQGTRIIGTVRAGNSKLRRADAKQMVDRLIVQSDAGGARTRSTKRGASPGRRGRK